MRLSAVLSFYNEENVLPELIGCLRKVLDAECVMTQQVMENDGTGIPACCRTDKPVCASITFC